MADVNPEELRTFHEVVKVLHAVLGDETALMWLNTPHPLLGEQLPIDVINAGHGYQVRNVAYLIGR